MAHLVQRMWQEEEGVLSFEWILLLTLLTIGIVSGIAGVRDALIDELGDVSQAAIALDQSYVLAPSVITSTDGVSIVVVLQGSEFLDSAPFFSDCGRGSLDGEGPQFD